LVDDRLELVVLERLDLAAVVADEMVVVLAGREGGLVPRRAGADVDPLHEPAFGELLEHAIDGGDYDPAAAAGAQPVEDLLRRQAAGLPAEELDDGAACATAAALRLERGERLLAPGGHALDHSENQYRYRLDARPFPLRVRPARRARARAARGRRRRARHLDRPAGPRLLL